MNIDMTLFPTVNDYPHEMFDIGMPKAYRVGCGRAYLKSNSLTRSFFIKRIKEAFRLLPQRDYQTILDLGTGAGFYLPLLSQVGRKVYGVDLAQVLGLTHKMVVKKGINNVFLYKSDITKLPFKSESFDLLFCLSLIEHIPNQGQAFLEFKRVLKKNGILILGYPLQNLPQQIFEELNRYNQFAKFFIKFPLSQAIDKVKEAKRYGHNHVSDFGSISEKVKSYFMFRERSVVSLLGFQVYEILLLTI